MSPLSEYHNEIQKHAIAELRKSGFVVIEYVYHEVKDDPLKEQIKNCNAPECMFIRTFPDLLAFKDERSMFLEIKSKSPQYENLALELFPLMGNYYLEEMGLDIMYVYGYKDKKGEISLYYLPTKELVKLVDTVIITDKFDERMNGIFRDFSLNILKIDPKEYQKIKKRKTSSENVGSADPFVLIKKDNLTKLKKFENLVQQRIK